MGKGFAKQGLTVGIQGRAGGGVGIPYLRGGVQHQNALGKAIERIGKAVAFPRQMFALARDLLRALLCGAQGKGCRRGKAEKGRSRKSDPETDVQGRQQRRCRGAHGHRRAHRRQHAPKDPLFHCSSPLWLSI